MKWSRGPQRIFDGGAVGRDTVNVFRRDSIDAEAFQPFDYEDAQGSESVEAVAVISEPPAASAPAAPPPPPGVPVEEVEQREQASYERGRQDGLRAGDENLHRLTEQLEGAMNFFHDTINKLDEQASRQALELGLMLAEKLFRKAVEADPDRLIASVAELVQATDADGTLRILVDPKTAGVWRSTNEALKEIMKDRPFEVEAKDELAPGDVILHGGSVTLDERVSNRVRQYTHALEQELGLTVSD